MTQVDVVIPVLNEEIYISECLESVLAFKKPAGVECVIYIVDGGSRDRTREMVERYATTNPSIRMLDNPGRIQSCALNLAIRQGTGEFILRLDAHAKYPSDYLRKCMESVAFSDADNVGGTVRTIPGADTYAARVVQAVTTHRFGVGNAEFRLLPKAGPADTVPFGFFKRGIFQKVGFFDERLVRNQDYDLNRRILASGGRIWLDPGIVVHYYNQATLTGFLKKQVTKEGVYNAYLWYLAPYARAWRHGITGAFAAGVMGGFVLSFIGQFLMWIYVAILGIYAVLACASAVQQAIRYRSFCHCFTLPVVFFLFHFTHGCGFLCGVGRLLSGTAPVQQVREPWPGAGRYHAWPIP